MAEIDTDIQSKVLELATDALDAFCDDISGMFDVDMECSQQDSGVETAAGLKKRFKKLTAVNAIQAKGSLHGTFFVVFDQGGLFTLSGVVVMLPENRIKEEIKRGSEKEAEHMSDAISELGNMMVGTWDRVFREELPDHEHFKQTSTFIGKPWEDPQGILGMEADEEFVFVPYEVTVGTYPTFECGVVFPNAVFEPEPEPDPEPEPEEEADTAEGESAEAEQAEAEGKEDSDAAEAEAGDNEPAEAESDADEAEVESAEAAAEENAEITETEAGPVSRAIKEMTSAGSQVSMGVSFAATAEQIMQKDVVWAEESDTVQQTLNSMQQHEAGYVMVGKDGVLEGIVSRSDIAGAISPYLRPVFAKWKRPLDDATLQIRISWIMTKPVRTITPQTPIDVIVDTMLHFGGRCLPVVGKDGKLVGMVTAFDVFKLLGSGGNVGQAGKTPQMPVVV